MEIESPIRKKILDVASRLFAHQGYNSTGINQVIAEAGIARGSLYNYFPTKTDLLNAHLDTTNENWFKALEAFLAGKTDPVQRILGIFDFRMIRQIDESFAGCPFVKISNEVSTEEKRAFELVIKHKDHLKAYISDLVSQIKPNRQFLQAEALAETIFLLGEGAIVMVNIKKRNESLANAKKIVQQLLA